MDNLKKLGRAMSDVSERCYCAGWLIGTEYQLPELCRRITLTKKPHPWGYSEVTVHEASNLQMLVQEVGSWVNLVEDASGYVLFNPFPIPEKHIVELDRQFTGREEQA